MKYRFINLGNSDQTIQASLDRLEGCRIVGIVPFASCHVGAVVEFQPSEEPSIYPASAKSTSSGDAPS